MKNYIYTVFAAAVCIIVLQSFNLTDLGKMRDGSEPGHTGSPADGKNCTVCHGGRAETVVGWISSDIPASGFVPGTRYTIRAVNRSIGHTRFGFQVSPQNLQGNILGTLIATDTLRTKIVGDNNGYITYRPAGVVGQDSMVWTFDWIAPADSVNEVVFYGAFNSNHDGHKGGDRTQLSQLRVFKEGFTSLQNNTPAQINIRVYPNPAKYLLHIDAGQSSNQADVFLYDLNGRKVFESRMITAEIDIDVSALQKGIYLLRVCNAEGEFSQRVFIH